LTQQKLAKEADVERNTYGRWEREEHVPGQQLHDVVEVLNSYLDRRSVTADWIWHGNEDGE
jgi:DNA-binding XRE family transcriptional regulator